VLGTLKERVQIAKDFLKETEFLRKVDETFDNFFNDKKTFDEQRLVFKVEEKTEDLKLYVEKIKENAAKFEAFQCK